MQKKIEKALKDAGLSLRDATSFTRVRVVGLTKCGGQNLTIIRMIIRVSDTENFH